MVQEKKARRASPLGILLIISATLIGGLLGIRAFQVLISGQTSPRASEVFVEILASDPRMRLLSTVTFFIGGAGIAFALFGLCGAIVRLHRLWSARREFAQRRVLLAATAERQREEFREAELQNSTEGLE